MCAKPEEPRPRELPDSAIALAAAAFARAAAAMALDAVIDLVGNTKPVETLATSSLLPTAVAWPPDSRPEDLPLLKPGTAACGFVLAALPVLAVPASKAGLIEDELFAHTGGLGYPCEPEDSPEAPPLWVLIFGTAAPDAAIPGTAVPGAAVPGTAPGDMPLMACWPVRAALFVGKDCSS